MVISVCLLGIGGLKLRGRSLARHKLGNTNISSISVPLPVIRIPDSVMIEYDKRPSRFAQPADQVPRPCRRTASPSRQRPLGPQRIAAMLTRPAVNNRSLPWDNHPFSVDNELVRGQDARQCLTVVWRGPKLSPFGRYHLGAGPGRVVDQGTGEPRGIANWREAAAMSAALTVIENQSISTSTF